MRQDTIPTIPSTRANDLRIEHIRKTYIDPSSSHHNQKKGQFKPPYGPPFQDDFNWSGRESTAGRHSSLENGSQRSRTSTDPSCGRRTVDRLKSGGKSNSRDISGVGNRFNGHSERPILEDKIGVDTNGFQMQPQDISSNYQLRTLSTVSPKHTAVDRSLLERPMYLEKLMYSRYHRYPTSVNQNLEEYSNPTFDNGMSNDSTSIGQNTTKNLHTLERKVQSKTANKDNKNSNTSNSPTNIHQYPLETMSDSEVRKHTLNEIANSYTSPRSDSTPDLNLRPKDFSSDKEMSASAANSVPGLSGITRGRFEKKTQPYTLPTEQNVLNHLSRDHKTTDTNHHVSPKSFTHVCQNEMSPTTTAQEISGKGKQVSIPSTSEEKGNDSDRKVSEAANQKQEESEVNLKDNFNRNKEMNKNMRQSFDKTASGENPVKLSYGEGRLKLQDADQHNNSEQDEIAMHQHQSHQQQNPLSQSTVSSKQHIASQRSSKDSTLEVQDRKMSYLKNQFQHQHEKGIQVFVPRPDTKRHFGRIYIGEKATKHPEKVLLLVGGTGSGKTTWINGLFNYIHGMEWSDNARVKLIDEMEQGKRQNQAKSQTKEITPYTIHYQPWFKIPFTMTVIDTPGFGDTEGIERDKKIIEQIRDFFTTKTEYGIDHIDAVGFVIQSSLARLTPTQRYVFNSILSLFGKDVANNIFLLLTFADSQKAQVISGIKEADLPYNSVFKFNNSALYVSSRETTGDEDEDDGDRHVDHIYWKMGTRSYKKFMKTMITIQPQSLTLTKEVLRERQYLEVTMDAIQQNIKMGLMKLEQLETEKKLLKEYKAYIYRKEDLTYQTYEHVVYKMKLASGEYATNCSVCEKTCHMKCAYSTEKKKKCLAIKDDHCTVCPYKCHWRHHRSEPFVYELRVEKTTKTAEALCKRYEVATGKKLTTEQIIETCRSDLYFLNKEAVLLAEKARICLERLRQIALKPNPLSTTDYIDWMIEEEKFLAATGWRDSVRQLQQVKERARIMQRLIDQKKDISDKKRLKSIRRGQDGLTDIDRIYLSLRRSTEEPV